MRSSFRSRARLVPLVLVSVGLIAGLMSVAPQAAVAVTNTFQQGDVFVGVSNGQVQWRRGGTLIDTLDTGLGGYTTGMAFDASGNLYVTNFSDGSISKFDTSGTNQGTFGPSDFSNPESMLFNQAGDKVFVGEALGSIRSVDGAGNAVATYANSGGSDWIDLASNQCTVYYTHESTDVFSYDTCTATQGPNFNASPLPGGQAFAIRLLPGGGMLVADSASIVRLDTSGAQVQTYDAPATGTSNDSWFALNLDPDGLTFWSADITTGDVYRFNIATGAIVDSFNTGTGGSTVYGLAVAGEITTGGQQNNPPGSISGLEQSDVDGPIGVGATTAHQDVTFQGQVSDPDASDTVQMELEAKPVGTAFDGTGTLLSDPVSSGLATVNATLDTGTSYHWRARAVDNHLAASTWVPFGDNLESATDFRVAGGATCEASVPDAPTNVTAYAGNTTAAVSWDAPVNDGGATIESYNLFVHHDVGEGFTTTEISGITDTKKQVNGLTNGDNYFFTVSAVNCAGEGPESGPSDTITPNANSSAEVIGPGNLSQSTGNTAQPTTNDLEIGAQQFPTGTTGVGSITELHGGVAFARASASATAVGAFCGGVQCLDNMVLEQKLTDGHIGDRPSGRIFYSARILYDKTLRPGTGTNYPVYYDGNLSDDNNTGGDPTPPRLLPKCGSTGFKAPACVAKISRLGSGDLKIVVRTEDVDPRIGVR